MGLAWGGGIGLLGMVQGSKVVGGGLVDVVVEPVGVEQLGGGAPAHHGLFGGVVVGEVEHGEVLFAVAFDFHFCLWDFNGLSMGF